MAALVSYLWPGCHYPAQGGIPGKQPSGGRVLGHDQLIQLPELDGLMVAGYKCWELLTNGVSMDIRLIFYNIIVLGPCRAFADFLGGWSFDRPF
jgi:hypothetical protein